MAGDTGVDGRVMAPFCQAKRKIGNKGKRERVSRRKLLKCYHQVLNVPVLAIPERLEFKIFLVNQPWWPTILQCFVALPLWNPFCRPWASDNVSGVLEIIIMKLDYILLLFFCFFVLWEVELKVSFSINFFRHTSCSNTSSFK